METNHRVNRLGFGTIEVLVSLLISSTLFLLSFPALKMLVYLELKTLKEESIRQRADLAVNLVADAARQGDTFYALPGIFLNVNKLKNEKPGNDSLTVTKLVPDAIFQIVEINSPTLACRGEYVKGGNTDYKDWLLLSNQEQKIVRGKLKQVSKKEPLCPGGKLYAFTGSETIKNAHLIVAIDDIFTLFLDSENTLRRISSLSEENQPVIKNIEALHLALGVHPNGSRLVIEVTTKDKKSYLQRKIVSFTRPINQTENLADLAF